MFTSIKTQIDLPYTDISAFLLSGIYIQDYHDTWYKDYETLEHVHTFIQW